MTYKAGECCMAGKQNSPHLRGSTSERSLGRPRTLGAGDRIPGTDVLVFKVVSRPPTLESTSVPLPGPAPWYNEAAVPPSGHQLTTFKLQHQPQAPAHDCYEPVRTLKEADLKVAWVGLGERTPCSRKAVTRETGTVDWDSSQGWHTPG